MEALDLRGLVPAPVTPFTHDGEVDHAAIQRLGAWLGSKAFQATGSYDWMWYADIVLAVGAALIHLPIREARLPARLAASPA